MVSKSTPLTLTLTLTLTKGTFNRHVEFTTLTVGSPFFDDRQMGRSTMSTMNIDTDEFWMLSSPARLTPGNLSSTFFMDVFFTLQCQMTLSGGDWRLGHTMMTRSQCTDTHFHILIRIDHKGFWGSIRDTYGTIISHSFFFCYYY